MVKSLAHDDHVRITESIAAAKRRTSVDIRLVSMQSSSHYGGFAIIHSLLAAVIAECVVCVGYPQIPTSHLIIVQIVIALIALLCLQNRWLRGELVPKSALRKAAWRRARLTYADLQLRSRHDAPSVLLFCSKTERYAEILADERVLEHVPEAVWQDILKGFMPYMKKGDPAAGFLHLVERSASALENTFPAL